MGDKLLANVSSIIGVGLLLVILFSYFIRGGVQQITDVSNWFTQAALWANFISIYIMVKVNLARVQRHEPGEWFYSLIFFATFALSAIIGITLHSNSYMYVNLYNIFYGAGIGSAMAMSGLAMIMSVNRSMLPSNPRATWMLILFVIGLFSVMPIGILFPPLKVVGDWMNYNIFGFGEQAGRIALSIGEAAIIARLICFNEKFKPAG